MVYTNWKLHISAYTVLIILIQRNLIDQFQFFFSKRYTESCFYIVEDLLWLGCADQNAGNFFVLKQPAKSHVCKLFTTLCSQIIEFTNLIQSVFIQSAFFKESSVCTDTTVFWDSVKITVCQLSLCKWAECDQTFLKFTGCFSIREVSEMFDLPASTLRYYESEGLFRYNGVLSIFDYGISTSSTP